MTWAIEAHSKVPPTDFCFQIALDFVENGPLLYLLSGYYSRVVLKAQSRREKKRYCQTTQLEPLNKDNQTGGPEVAVGGVFDRRPFRSVWV